MSELKDDFKFKLILRFKKQIQSTLGHMHRLYLGRTLTIIDASIADPEQRKAVKDMVKGAFSIGDGWSNDIWEIFYQYDGYSENHAIQNDKQYREFFGLEQELLAKDKLGRRGKAVNYFADIN